MSEGNEVHTDPYDPNTQQDVEWTEKHKLEADAKARRGILEQRKGSYTRVFISGQPTKADRELVTADLKLFCRFNMSAFHPEERVHTLLTGRQEAYYRINDFTTLSVDELIMKYDKPPTPSEA
jgi:hypothetical protein